MPASVTLPKNKTPFVSPKTTAGYPRESIKKMAVLFTDIVGSSAFFRSHGDIEGRRMLRKHQDLATPPIIEHGGVLVKMLGDSVMAYFLNAREALKSAIKIQEKFRHHNHGKEHKAQIHIRLGIHFGDGIVEERDIFGDVVNMAAKFLPLVQGDQIVISQQVRDQVRDLPSVHLQPFEFSRKDTALPEGFTLFQVLWDANVNFDPLMKTLIYFRPLFNLGKADFAKTWADLLNTKDRFWGGKVEKETLLQDKSVVIIVRQAAFALTLAKNISEFLRDHLGQEAVPFVPIQILIDAGSYLRAGRLDLGDLKVNWEEIKPGGVYISPSAHDHIKRTAKISITPAPDPGRTGAFYKIDLQEDHKDESRLFLYQGALIQGEYSPCFYCGDRRHATTNCPSKGFTEITHGLSQLGYRPVEEINNLFFNYLNGTAPKLQAKAQPPASANKSEQWAVEGFYELKAVYQLRFFRALWDAREENWNRIGERSNGGGEGGLVWIGQDCIRVSNLAQAQSILLDSLNKNPQDYKVYCALGFLNIEKEDFAQAKYYINKGLEKARTTPQKIFLHFLLSRLYDLGGDAARAEEMIRKIRYLNPYCYEALYQEIVFQFLKGRDAVALHQLIKLIRKNREYYLHALIDPDLAAYSAMIHKELKGLLEEAEDEALKLIGSAKSALQEIKRWLDDKDLEMGEAQSRWQKIEELSRAGSYFGYLDIIHYARNIINMGHTCIESRREKLITVIDDLNDRTDKYLSDIRGFQYTFLVDNVRRDLLHIQARISKDWTRHEPAAAVKFREVYELATVLSSELDDIGARIRKLDIARRILLFITGFFKKSLIFQSANLFVAMILFPILAYYLNFMIPVFTVTSQNMWSYQKGVLILGGISGLLLAVVSTAKNLHAK